MQLFFIGLLLTGAAIAVWQLLTNNNHHPAAAYLYSRESDVLHMLMNTCMAIMLTPYHGSTQAFIVAVYYLAALLLLIRIGIALRSTPPSGVGSSCYHLLVLLVMIFSATQMHHADMAHAHHIETHSVSWLAYGLGILFALDGFSFLLAAWVFPRAVIDTAIKKYRADGGDEVPTAALPSLAIIRVGATPHIIMDAGMVYMLLVPSAMM